MRILKAVGQLIGQLWLMTIAVVMSTGRGRVVFAAAAVAVLVALVMLDASAGANLPGNAASNKASTATW